MKPNFSRVLVVVFILMASIVGYQRVELQNLRDSAHQVNSLKVNQVSKPLEPGLADELNTVREEVGRLREANAGLPKLRGQVGQLRSELRKNKRE